MPPLRFRLSAKPVRFARENEATCEQRAGLRIAVDSPMSSAVPDCVTCLKVQQPRCIHADLVKMVMQLCANWGREPWLLVGLLAGGLALACVDSSSEKRDVDSSPRPTVVPVPLSDDVGSCESIATPGGPVPKSCVHEVPDGAHVSYNDAGQTIVSNGGMILAVYPRCGCASADASASLAK